MMGTGMTIWDRHRNTFVGLLETVLMLSRRSQMSGRVVA